MGNGSWERSGAVGCALFAIAWQAFVAFAYGMGSYPLDDALIVQSTVSDAISGVEPRFVGATRWSGITSPAYAFPVAALALVLPVTWAQWGVSAVASVLLCTCYFAMFRQAGVERTLALAGALASFIAGMTLFHVANGLETGMAMATVGWLLVAFSRESPPWWGYVVAALAFLVRPELAALGLCCIGYALFLKRGKALKGVGVAAVAVAVAAAGLFLVTGSVFAETASAKSYFFAEGCQPLQLKAKFGAGAIANFVKLLGPFALGFLLVPLSRAWPIAIGFSLAMVAAYVIKLPGALYHNEYRYLHVLIPIAVMGWSVALPHRHRWIRILAVAAGSIALVLSALSVPRVLDVQERMTLIHSVDSAEAAEWVASRAPHDAVVLVHDAGRISLSGSQTLVDLVGLKTPSSIEVHKQITAKACGYRPPEAIHEIALESGASYAVFTTDWDNIFRLGESLSYMGWQVERADHERGETHYRVFRIKAPTAESKPLQ